jgi:small-conductance mechanosensitive channel
VSMDYFLSTVLPALIAIAVAIVLERVLAVLVTRFGRRRELDPSSVHLIKLTIRWLIIIVLVIVVAGIFGIGLQGIWVSIAAFLAMVVVGFFAAWSMLSNIFAAILLLILRPLRIGDKVSIMPENISGKVTDIGMIFTRIESDEGDAVNIPNNLLMQRFLKVYGQK